MLAVQVNDRWFVQHAAYRAEVIEAVTAALADGALTVDVEGGEVGAVGLPTWTVLIFHADHGDYDRLHADVTSRVGALGLGDKLVPLTPTTVWR